MSDPPPGVPSVMDRVREFDAGGPVVGAHVLGEVAVFSLGEEHVVLGRGAEDMRRVAVHGGGILASASDGRAVLTGGDDGKVVLTSSAGDSQTIATDAKRRWIDNVAMGPGGAVAWSAGKEAFVRTASGEVRSLAVSSTVGGLAFAPKGVRLAIAHYNGVTLWFPNAPDAKPEFLEWKGSHLGVTFSPDGRFLVTTMHEPMLHGWRLADGRHMRMAGYPARVHSVAWSGDGKWLASSGASQLVLWPFQGKDGPMGKEPKVLAPMKVRVDRVACHPAQDVLAAGFIDGLILLVRIGDGAEILARKPGGSPVTAMNWDLRGTMMVWGCEDGRAGVLTP